MTEINKFYDADPLHGRPHGTAMLAAYLNSLGLPPTITTPIRTVTASTTIQKDTDYIVHVDATAGAVVLNLPSVLDLFPGRKFIFKKIDATANPVSLTPYGSETIDTASVLNLTKQNETASIIAATSKYQTEIFNSNYEVDALHYSNGTNFTKATIDAALTALGTTTRATLLLRPGTWVIDDDLTIPENITLKVPAGAVLQIATGVTLTIKGPFEAGLYQVFSGDGSVSGLKEAHPIAFGATGDGIIDDTVAVRRMFSALYGAISSKAIIPSGYTVIVSSAYIPSNCTVTGGGTIKHKGGSNGSASSHMLTNWHAQDSPTPYTTEDTNIVISGITIDGNKSNQDGNFNAHAIHFRRCYDWKIVGCHFKNTLTAAISGFDSTNAPWIDASTPPNTVDAPGRGIIAGNTFTDIGKDIDAGSGYGTGYGVQFDAGSFGISVIGNTFYNVIFPIVIGTYAHDNNVIGNILDAGTLSYPSAGIAFTQFGNKNIANGNIIKGYYGGILCEGIFDCDISGNVISDCNTYGVKLFTSTYTGSVVNCDRNQILNNKIKGTTGTSGPGISATNGTLTATATGNKFLGNTIIDGAYIGIYIRLFTDVYLTNNTISQNGSYGIGLFGVNGFSVLGNKILNNTDSGVYLSQSGTTQTSDGIINSNIISENTNYGVAMYYTTSNILLKNNKMNDNTVSPIYKASTIDRSTLQGEKDIVYFGTTAAGDTRESPLFYARENSFILDVRVANDSDITQNDTNYDLLSVIDRGSDDVVQGNMIYANTKLTGGVDINARRWTTLAEPNVTYRTLAKGDHLTFKKAPSASGQGTTNMQVMVDYIEY